MASALLQAVPQAAIYAFPAAIAAGAYVNAKLGIGPDLKTWKAEKEWEARLGQRLQEFEGRCTLWGLLDAGNPEAEMLWFEGRTWTYGALKIEVNKFAKVLQDNGVGNNDFVAVFTTNSPEMVVAILAISRLGGTAALINTNLRGDTFTHCMSVSKAKLIVSSPDLTPYVVVDGSFPHLSLNFGSFDTTPPFSSSPETPFSTAIQKIDLRSPSHTEITTSAPTKTPAELSVLIYTSGTTGRPKACAIRNLQIFVVANPLTIDLHPPHAGNLRTYSALPLFHGTGFFTGVGYMLGTGGTVCLARKFSASRFFKDVHDSGATRILYIGELCRYLLAAPPSKYDKDHKCLVAAGNGLRREIWDEFKERFNIPEIREFYRSTEGIAKFDNHGKAAWGAGRVGFAGPLRRRLETDTFLIRCDPDTGDPIRDPKTGFCIKCKLNEPGEAIGRVKNRKMITEYLGNEKATEEKLLHDVFTKGDCWQRMGDLLVMGEDGWVRFHDRIGDSFRWKGENVSAGEVRDLICELPNVQDAVVFGVRLSRYDGQAGAAVIVLKNSTPGEREVFMNGLYKKLREEKGLPTYAVPRLVRIAESIGTGVTFKQGKADEAKKPWKPEAYKGGKESLYWLDGMKGQEVYRVLDGEAWGGIESGKAKL